MIKSTDQSVHDDIKEVLIDEYTMLLEMYESFERTNRLGDALAIKTTMHEVCIISYRLLGYDISPFALKRFQ